jgi:hypothetical protein
MASLPVLSPSLYFKLVTEIKHFHSSQFRWRYQSLMTMASPKSACTLFAPHACMSNDFDEIRSKM